MVSGPAEAEGAASSPELTLIPPHRDTVMADSSSPAIVATPYPTYISPGGDDHDEVFKAALITQGDASTQRNQDSQFAAMRDQLLQRDVVDGKFSAVVAAKDAEVRTADRFAEVGKELAALRAEAQARDIAQLRAELAESKADGRQAKTESLLAAILAKLPV